LSNLKRYESKSFLSSGLFSSLSKIFPGIRSYQDVWDRYLLPTGIPLLIGLGGGILVALLIARELWVVALAFVFIVPVVIVLNKYPFVVILIWFVLMPFLPVGGVPSSVLWLVHRALIPLGLGIVILSWMLGIKEYKPIKFGPADWSMIIFLSVAVVSVLVTQRYPLLYLYQLYDRVFVGFAAYWLVRLSNPDEDDLKRLTLVMLLVCWAEITFGFWARYTPQSLPALFQFSRMGERMSGTFNNPTPYAYILITCMLFLFHYAMTSQSKALKGFFVFTFAVGMFCLFLTFTRGVWGAAILVLLGLLILYPKPMLKLLAFTIPLFLILAGGALADEVVLALERLNTQDTIDSRVVLTYAGKQMFYTKPIFGWGYDSYDKYDWQFMERAGSAVPTKWDIQYGTSHNTYITILAETGIVGFFFLFFPVLWWLWQTLKSLPKLPQKGFYSWRLVIIMWLSILFYLISSQVVDMRFFWYHLGLFWLILGLISNLAQSDWKLGEWPMDSALSANGLTDAISRGNIL